VALCCAALLNGGVVHASRDAPDRKAAGTSAQPDREIEALLRKTEQQVAEGRTVEPKGDNALATWRVVLEHVSPPTSEGLRALSDFVTQARLRAAADQAAGRIVVASDLSVFADQAADLVAHGNAVPSPTPVTVPPVPTLASVPVTVPAETTPARADEAAPVTVARLESVTSDHPAVSGTIAPIVPLAAPGEAAAASVPGRTVAAEPGPDPVPAALPAAEHAAPDRSVPEQSTRMTAASDRSAALPVTPDHTEAIGSSLAHPAGIPTAPVQSVALAPASDHAAAVRDAPGPSATAPSAADRLAAASLVGRGDAMMAIKDISAARKFYMFAANAGDARAALAMARTYDPALAGQMGTFGLKPDASLAALWYRKAATLGDADATARVGLPDRQAAR